MDPATMSYAQLLRAYQALQEHVSALEGAAALQHSAPAWEYEAQHTTGTGAMVSVPEAYLTGGGEMGQRIRAYDWSATPLGPVETWPQSLKSAVSILLPSKAQIILFWGPELIAIYNDAYAPVFGAKHPWALGQPARECWSEVWHVLGPLFAGVVRTGEAFWAKDHPFFLYRQGFLEETYYDVSYDPVRIEDGSVGGIFCIVNDQTGRVLGERRLRTLRDLGTRTATAKSAEEVCREAVAVLALDPADVPFSLLYLSAGSGRRAALVSTGGVGLDDLATGHDRVLDDVEVQAAEVETTVFVRQAPESAAERALVLPITSGTQIVGAFVAGVSRFLRLAGDYGDFFDLAVARISAALAHVRAYEEERRRAEILAELDRAKTAFFSNVSHEFRTPLTLMLGPLEDILAKPADQVTPDNRELLTIVHRNSLRLLRLVNTLLDFSRLEAGRVQAVYEPTDLATLTADLASNFRSACERAGLRLVVDCPPLPEPIYVDREMWEKIILNLLSNAFKFTLDGEITITLRPAGEAVELAISDTGTGIPAAEIPHLFERFYRVAGVWGRTQEGTGIGLALVQELVQLHGGSVRVESALGHGSTFLVTIPMGQAHLPADRIGGTRTLVSTALGASPYVEEALRWLPDAAPLPLLPVGPGMALDVAPARLPAAPPLPALDGAAGRRARIVWADDNADMRDYVRRLLSVHYDVEAVVDGKAALAAVRTRLPDLVLTDVMMPQLDGFGLLRALRSDPETRTLPIILLSARAGEESRIEGLQVGADDYLVKPFSARELLARVSSHLELGRLRARIAQEHTMLAELFRQTPMPIAVLRGSDLVYDMANLAYLQVVGGRNILGKPLLEAFPEWHGQGFDQLLHGVMHTGVPHVGHEVLVKLERQDRGAVEDTYWTFIYAPLLGESGEIDRVIAICNEVTESVRARQQLEIQAAEVTVELLERTQQEAAQRLLAEISTALATALDTTTQLESLARLLVPTLADWCSIDLLEADGQIHCRALTHADATKAVLVQQLWTHYPVLPYDAEHTLARVLRTGHSWLDPAVTATRLRAEVQDGTRGDLLQALGFASEMVVPLLARGRVLGTLTCVRGTGSQGYGATDLAFAEEIAYRAACAIDNARLYHEARAAQMALQQAHDALEQRVQERTALVEMIQDITRAANEALGSAEALQYAVHRICAHTGWPVGHAYLAVAVGTKRWAPTDIWHLDSPQRYTAFQQVTQTVECAAGEGMIGRVGALGKPEWNVDVSTDLTFHRQRAALEAGLKAGVAVPILIGHEVAGILEFYAAEALAPHASLLDALTQMGTQLGRVVERERATEQLQRQQEALVQQEKLAAMSTMLASVAHELNNPLAIILMQAGILREDLREGPLAEPVTEIVQAAARCERLVRQFLTLARQHPPERSEVALNTLVAETVELLAYPLRVDNVTVHLHLDDQLPLLWGDPHQLQQVLINLLTNAQQALRAAPGAREVTITTHYDPTQHQITLAVADTGPGMPLLLQGRIFEPFFTTKPPGVGTGLGLPLCRGIIEAHGGTLEVTSAPGCGATFRLTLPVGAGLTHMPAAPGTDEELTVHNHTILIIDDELSLANGLARLLRRTGHTVETVANGRLALAKLDERTYDLILCDMRMPDLDGPSLYRLLERQKPHLCSRFIFLTGDTLEPATQAFLEQSNAPCLTKPFSIAEARRAIQRALHTSGPATLADTLPAARASTAE
jgi:signal transduction histidine kinase/DNA-binding response OmpR family regulator